ncbi:nitroreductase family protein [Pseudarthrobacter sp. fls2-241-R2A-168]|uniref:nitroreductase family protein n=1 Tax=Pseudarthrobacter sp. fls2-241-R2A-168 TaxID=3040304 RepID=UPI0025522D97|nr:nitroreductase family protein [Pseudarthrobacter sp. fls2-241-R2A-168]
MNNQALDTDTTTMTAAFQRLLKQRVSYRAFRPEPIDDDTLRQLFSDALWAPSNCNTQPWEVHVVSGEARDRLVDALIKAAAEFDPHPDFSFDVGAYKGALEERRKAQGASYYQALGVRREDHEKRRGISQQNYQLFGAPHVAFLFMPEVGDSVRVASDVGMFAQTFLLALAARGLAGVPQTSLGGFPDLVRNELQIPSQSKLLFGISFGTPDTTSAAYAYRIGRESLETLVSFHSS